jgi:hypothetical protein
MVDPGEPCDPELAGRVVHLRAGRGVLGDLYVHPDDDHHGAPTTTTSVNPRPRRSLTSSTLDTCGNGMVDPGEPCDLSSPSGAFTCAPGEVCSGSLHLRGREHDDHVERTADDARADDDDRGPDDLDHGGADDDARADHHDDDVDVHHHSTTLYGSPSRAFLSAVGGLLE